jgi:hypothetical protein
MKKNHSKNFEKLNSCDRCSVGAFYGLGFVGSLIYYLSTASNFFLGLLGILKSIIWPVFFVFEILKFLGA